jgi:FlaA1/EpsC-like NDP-sugar epimerase
MLYKHLGLNNAEVLITGGTGTIGKEIAKELLKQNKVKGIRLFSRDEEKHRVARDLLGENKISYLVGDITDKDRLFRAMNGVDIVIHAAAMKQVPACEDNPIEAVKTNIVGTSNVIDCAINNEVRRVFFISTDKAVRPLNLYGATKCVAEKLIIDANKYSPNGTKFSACRYGNILGSRGSVLKIWKDQINEGKDITITDPNMTRFWIRKQEAVKFILNCIEHMEGGELFIPKMKSCRMTEFAEAFMIMEGIVDTHVFNVITTGVRPGEKLHEEIATAGETYHLVDSNEIFKYSTEESFDSFKSERYTIEELAELIKEAVTNG